MMSMRPSAVAACSTKFFASASWRRSAAIGTILRPVAAAISFAVAANATSTPSWARANAMPLPMPSLLPVTGAVMPLSFRSIRGFYIANLENKRRGLSSAIRLTSAALKPAARKLASG